MKNLKPISLGMISVALPMCCLLLNEINQESSQSNYLNNKPEIREAESLVRNEIDISVNDSYASVSNNDLKDQSFTYLNSWLNS